MNRTKSREVVAGALVALALGVAACGGDDAQDPAAAAAPDREQAPAGGGEVPSTGVAAKPAGEVATCLEEAGFTVSTDTSAPEELREQLGVVDQLTLVGGTEGAGEPGAGAITYYRDDSAALEAQKAELDMQEGGSVVGRTSSAVYAYAGGDTAAARQAIEECL